jgi:hypothetical protein
MQIVEIVVHAGRTFNHPYEDYSNLRPSVSMKATLGPEDNPEKTAQELQARAEALVEICEKLYPFYGRGKDEKEPVSDRSNIHLCVDRDRMGERALC